jgi:GT2 family glycosyltransferase
MTVAAIIPNFNGRHLLPTLLTSLTAQRERPDEIIIVDNASTDGSAQYVRDVWPGVTLIAHHLNSGFSAAVNKGIASSATTYVALLNTDVELDPSWLESLVQALDKNPGAGSAASKMVSWHDPTRLDGAGDKMTWSGIAVPRGHGQSDRGQFDTDDFVFGARAGAALYRRAALRDVGLFDEDFFAFVEDVDWSLRAQLRGWSCRYASHAIAFHMGGATANPGERPSPQFYAMTRRNLVWTIIKDYPADALFRHAPSLLAAQLILCLIAIRDGMTRAYIKGLLAAMVGIPRVLRKRRSVQKRRTVGRRELNLVMSPGLLPTRRRTRTGAR